MVNTAIKGRKYEHDVKHMFEQNGYIVTRAASSKGPWDLIAIKENGENKRIAFMVLVQCKIKATKPTKADSKNTPDNSPEQSL